MFRKIAGFIAAAGLVATVACSQSDAGITTNVKSKLAADDTVKAYQVDVDTRDHVVTLTGNVESSAAKDRAIEIARGTEGVRDVIDQIRVNEAAATSGVSGEVSIDRDRDLRVNGRDDADLEIKVKDDAGDDIERGAEATGNAAKKVGDATVDGAKKAGRATVDGAKKVGGAVRDAVTDDDPDSDNDGK
jgi:hypothetical protein